MARNKNLELFKVKKILINSAMKDFKTMFFKIVWKQKMHKSLALRSKFLSEAAAQRDLAVETCQPNFISYIKTIIVFFINYTTSFVGGIL